MISNATFLSFAIAAVCTLPLPVAILVVLRVKKKIKELPLLLGAGAFFLSQIVLRIPLLNALSGQEWYNNFAEHYVVFLLLISLSAGLFEESARLGGALILKRHRSFKDIISFGLGHAFCEIIIVVGISYISNAVLCVAVNDSSGTLAAAVPPGTLETAMTQLTGVNPAHVYLGILERFSAVIFHIFATVLVFKGVIEKKLRYYALAILAHTLFNFTSVFLAGFAGIAIAEAALLVMALAAGYYANLQLKSYHKADQ
jgi:uncharacterized membrane protein YhfC